MTRCSSAARLLHLTLEAFAFNRTHSFLLWSRNLTNGLNLQTWLKDSVIYQTSRSRVTQFKRSCPETRTRRTDCFIAQLIVPRYQLNTYGRRAFSIAGPTAWNSLPHELRDPACGLTVLNSSSRQSSLVSTNVTSALEVFLYDMRYINPRFTYFTYLLTVDWWDGKYRPTAEDNDGGVRPLAGPIIHTLTATAAGEWQ